MAQRKNLVSTDCMRTAVKIDCIITLVLRKRKLSLGDTKAQVIVGQVVRKARRILAISRLSFTGGDFQGSKARQH